MYGCNNFCSYCTIPYTRGVARSREKKEIIDEFVKEFNLNQEKLRSRPHYLEEFYDIYYQNNRAL